MKFTLKSDYALNIIAIDKPPKYEFEEMGSDEISTDMLELIFSLYLGFAVIFGTIAGIWSFTANRFRIVECFFIIIAGAMIGCAIALIIQVISKFYYKK